MKKFEDGAQVRHKSGGRQMTAIYSGPVTNGLFHREIVRCSWIDGKGKRQTGDFDPVELVLVEEEFAGPTIISWG